MGIYESSLKTMKKLNLVDKAACKKLLKPFKETERYLRLDRIGSGGLAHVYSYFDTHLNRVVAVKELKKESCTNPHLLRAFIKEAKLLGYLDHSGIVQIFDTFINRDKQLCYTMKIIEGIKLTNVITYSLMNKDTYGVSINKLLRNFITMCETLAYVHEKGVLHLDLKPDNIMVGNYGEVVIMDWGNAHLYNKDPYYDFLKRYMDDTELAVFDEEAENLILGTPNYMSPEQASLQRKHLTAASDVYSAGIILYQILTKKHPFPDIENTKELIKRVRLFNPPPVHTINPGIPMHLSKICYKMLQKDRANRYKDFREVLKDFNQFRASGESFSTLSFLPYDVIVHEGDTGNFAFKILSGSVEVSKRTGSNKETLAVLGPGEIVGELSIFTNRPRSATVTAVDNVKILIMDRESVEKEIEKMSPWVGQMIASMSGRFSQMNNQIIDLKKRLQQ